MFCLESGNQTPFPRCEATQHARSEALTATPQTLPRSSPSPCLDGPGSRQRVFPHTEPSRPAAWTPLLVPEPGCPTPPTCVTRHPPHGSDGPRPQTPPGGPTKLRATRGGNSPMAAAELPLGAGSLCPGASCWWGGEKWGIQGRGWQAAPAPAPYGVSIPESYSFQASFPPWVDSRPKMVRTGTQFLLLPPARPGRQRRTQLHETRPSTQESELPASSCPLLSVPVCG